MLNLSVALPFVKYVSEKTAKSGCASLPTCPCHLLIQPVGKEAKVGWGSAQATSGLWTSLSLSCFFLSPKSPFFAFLSALVTIVSR